MDENSQIHEKQSKNYNGECIREREREREREWERERERETERVYMKKKTPQSS